MPDFLTFAFDPYDREARLKPALLTALPIFVPILLLIPEFDLIRVSLIGFIVCFGVTTFLTHVGRNWGKRLEPALFQTWGGRPSMAMLRHSDTRLAVATKERYRNFLMHTVPGLKLSSEEEEQNCPQKADAGYQSASDWLLTQTRDRGRFGLLFRENISYGFRRNIWALKRWAFVADCITIAIVAVVILVFDLWTGEFIATIQSIGILIWLSIFSTLIHILCFIFIVQKKWVRSAAEAYAQQLLAACDTLEGERKD